MGAPFPIRRRADLRARMEAAVERLIAALDALDAAGEDLEDGADDEPWLAAPEQSGTQIGWCRGTDQDLEEGDDNGIGDQGGLQEYYRLLEGV